MHEERRASVNVGAQHAQALVGCVPRLHDDIVEFVAQEIFDHALVPRLDFQEISEHAHRSQAALHDAGLKQAANGLG